MKILWISFFGSWTLPLLNRIKEGNEVHIIVPVSSSKDLTESRDGVVFHFVNFKKKELDSSMAYCSFQKYKKITDAFQPDIIHVHGTEKNLAQVQNYFNKIPVVVSIQGILYACKPYCYNYLDLKKVHRYRSIKNLLGFGGVYEMHKLINQGEYYENNIFSRGRYFIGRTNWDLANVMFFNPKAKYFKGEELLRDEFYKNAASWCVKKCNRHTIFMPSGFNPIKGAYLAIEAVALLRKYFDDVKIVIPGMLGEIAKNRGWKGLVFGEEYIRYILHRIKELGVMENVCFLPRMDAAGMAREMQRANVFLSPSSIDNSPNAVGEAMMIGVPLVTTPVGGELSFLRDKQNALFAPAGDPYMMAFQIKQIFENDELATRLSQNAHQTALVRHDREKTAQKYIDIYKEIIEDFK